MRRIWLFTIFLPIILHAGSISYTVNFEGLTDEKTLEALQESSELIALKKKKPSSLNALRFRAESDSALLTKILHNQGYLEGVIQVRIEEEFQEYSVWLDILPGPRYWLEQYQINLIPSNPGLQDKIPHSQLGIRIGMPVIAELIVASESRLIAFLAENGYPLAKVEKKDIIADGKSKTVLVTLNIDTGPLISFGPLTIHGNIQVKSEIIRQKIQWDQGDIYNQGLVDSTKKSLIDTGLFNSVAITHTNTPDKDLQLPLDIEVNETKHKSISIGATYQTTFGPGVTFGWENRNINGLGRKLSIQVDIAQRSHSGAAIYLIPNCFRMGQDFLVQAQAGFEMIKPYHARSYFLLEKFEWHRHPNWTLSVGAKTEYLIVTNSVENGHFFVFELPIFIRVSNVANRLNPERGFTFEYKGLPSCSVHSGAKEYLSQTFSLAAYWPYFKNDFLILAQKITVGSILSDNLEDIPVPKRIFGGSEEHLRGYRYYTVSPLKDHDKPKGGRSAIFYTLEPRFRLSKSWGLVPFFDLGNVYATVLPTFQKKWLKSVGLGIRYYSFIGPFRFDVAFPLDRRKELDPSWWVFVSIGQTF